MNPDVRIRPGTLDDNYTCAAILVDAINDLVARNGSIAEGHALELVGYGYVGRPERDGGGPFAALEPAHLPAVLSHAEHRRHELGASEAEFEVALHNRVAIDHLLDRGYRMDPFATLICSSEPFGSFDRYLFCSPALIL